MRGFCVCGTGILSLDFPASGQARAEPALSVSYTAASNPELLLFACQAGS